MCGIVGLITGAKNGLSNQEKEAFSNMLFVDMLRGRHSTGVLGVTTNGDVVVHKAAKDAVGFMGTTEYETFMTTMWHRGKFAVGHNRYATVGRVVDENAHPFVIENDIILFQNGTYYGSHKHHKAVEVDTEAIAHVIYEERDVAKALKRINAAYALVWYSTKERTLYMIRNDQRPLHIAYPKTGGVMFASEAATLHFAAMRNAIVLDKDPYMIKEHHLCKFMFEENGDFQQDHKDVDCKYDKKADKKAEEPRESWWRSRYGRRHDFYSDAAYVRNIPLKKNEKDDVQKNVLEFLMGEAEIVNNYAFDTEEAANDFIAKNYGKEQIIEFSDYQALNEHKECSVFGVWGHPLTPTGESDKLLCYAVFPNTSEADMLTLVCEQFNKAKIYAPFKRKFVNQDGISKYLVVAYMSDLEPIKMDKNNANLPS